jgi:RsiW-degrading membrane proteinase PrsW (M82 family)
LRVTREHFAADRRSVVVEVVRDGMILGAAVGFGFAAFESAGYALIPGPPSRYGTGR